MRSLLDHRLLVVTGKGGVGKTTIAAAIGMLAAGRGLRTIVVEVGDHGRLPELFGVAPGREGAEVRLQDGLSGTTIDPDRALLEWVQELGGRIPGRVLASSGTFQYFAAAAPGARELFAMVKIWELTQERRWKRRTVGYDLVVLDAPATGHALGMLRSPQTFGAIARVGPVAARAHEVGELLADPARSAYVAVAQGTEMAVTETIELQEGLREQIGRDLGVVIVNGLLPRRFTAAELQRIGALDGGPAPGAGGGHRGAAIGVRRGGASGGRKGAAAGGAAALARNGAQEGTREVLDAAAHAARAIHQRASFQHGQVARLRRRGFEVVGVPFAWSALLDSGGVGAIADRLGRRL